MALYMDIQTTSGGSYTAVDLEFVSIRSLAVDYSAPRHLQIAVHQPSHTLPLGIRNFVRLYDQDFSVSDPLFEGFLWEVQPDGKDANLVMYNAFDPSHMVGREVPVYSIAWASGTAPDSDAVPRLVVNCYQDSDSDYAIQRDTDVSVYGLIAGVLEDAILPLRYWNAAPPSTDAYHSELSSLTYMPQDKVVLENQYITASVKQALAHYPNRRLLWEPGTRLWRFHDLNAGTAQTVTLNLASGDNVVLGCDLRRSLDNCYTAVKFYGPEQVETAVYTTGASAPLTLSTVASIYMGTYTDGTGTHDINIPYSWQIDDVDLRRGGRMLETDYFAPMGAYNWVRTRAPHLQLSWDSGTSYITVLNSLMDFQNGIVSLGIAPYFYIDPAPGLPSSDQQVFGPTHARLVWASFVPSLSARAPATGFEGTAYSVANMESEMVIYDPTLAAGYEWGTAVTTATRIDQFEAAAQALLDQRKNIVYSGVIVLTGLHYEYLNLGSRVNIAAHDTDGSTLTTGWEAANMVVTGAVFDFQDRTTTLTINGDHLELMGEDPDQIKQRLGIRELTQNWEVSMQLQYSFFALKFGKKAGYTGISGGSIMGDYTYTDPETGVTET